MHERSHLQRHRSPCLCLFTSSIPSVSPAAEPSENRTSNPTFAVMLFTCPLQSDVLSRDTTCRGIGHLACASSQVPSPLSHRLQSQAKTALRTSHLQSCCSLAHYSHAFLAVTPPAEASVTLSVSVRAVPSPLSHRLQSQVKAALRTSHLQSCCSLAH